MELRYLSICSKEINFVKFLPEIFVKVRSTGKLLNAKIEFKDKNKADVNLKLLEDGISPGQACVFYKKDNLGYKVLGVSASLRNARRGLGNKNLLEDILSINNE